MTPSLSNFTKKKELIERMIKLLDLDKGRLVITWKGKVIVDKYKGVKLV